MKISIEFDKPYPGDLVGQQPKKITFVYEGDDMGARDMIEAFKTLMAAMGFAETTINEYLGEI